jgi:hypothetical protein
MIRAPPIRPVSLSKPNKPSCITAVCPDKRCGICMVIMNRNNKPASEKQTVLINLFRMMNIEAAIKNTPVNNIVYPPPGKKDDIIPRKVSVIKKWFRPIIPKGSANRILPIVAMFFMNSVFNGLWFYLTV